MKLIDKHSRQEIKVGDQIPVRNGHFDAVTAIIEPSDYMPGYLLTENNGRFLVEELDVVFVDSDDSNKLKKLDAAIAELRRLGYSIVCTVQHRRTEEYHTYLEFGDCTAPENPRYAVETHAAIIVSMREILKDYTTKLNSEL